jgi:hypothetical protein
VPYTNANLLPVNGSTFDGSTTAWNQNTANTVVSISTGEYLTTTPSTKILATAAGSIESISPRFLVTESHWYVVRIPIRVMSATNAAKVATGRITWYDATSGGTALGTVDFSLNLGITVGWQPNNYVVTSGKAPVGAKSATAKLTVTNMTAAEYVNIDDVYAADFPMLTGQLLTPNVSSMENDVSGWTATSATLDRFATDFTPGGYGTAGYSVLRATSTAIATVDVGLSAFVPVTAGTEYSAYALVRTPNEAHTVTSEIRWYNAGGTLLSTTSAQATAMATAANDRQAVVGVAPTGATQAKFFVRWNSTAVGQQVYVDDVTFRPSQNDPANLLTLNEWSTEMLPSPSWTVTNATLSRFYLTSSITDGFYMLKATATVPGMVSGQLDRLIPVTPGTTYVVRATGWRHSTDAVQSITSAMRVWVNWFDSAGTLFRTDNPDQFYPRDATGSYSAHIVSETRTAPVGAAYAQVGFEADCTSPLLDFWAFDNIHFQPATAEYTLTVNNSLGMVRLDVGSIQAAATAVTIERVDDNGRKVFLRGYGNVYNKAPYSPAPMLVEDYEAPLGSRVWYAITWWNGATQGTRLFTQTIDAPVLADGDYVWFKSPGMPAMNTTVQMEAPLKWTRAARNNRYDIVGRKNPVHVTSARAGRQSSITVLIWDPEDNALFDSLLDAGTAALIQAMPGYGIDANLYVSVGDADCDPLDPDARQPGWRWTLAITEVDRPDGGLQGSAGSTWQTILSNVAYPTWEDLFNAHATWADVLTEG